MLGPSAIGHDRFTSGPDTVENKTRKMCNTIANKSNRYSNSQSEIELSAFSFYPGIK
jgi:hypothetical protein